MSHKLDYYYMLCHNFPTMLCYMYKVGSIEISVHYARTNKPYEIYYVL